VPPSKRRKIEINSEALRTLWNALKNGKVDEIESGQFLQFSEEVSYLTGKNEQGSKISTLFIRECYLHLSKMIFENVNVCRWRITGNPGIGKTFFGYYLLHHLAQQFKTVVYHKYNMPPILFSKESVFSSSIDNIHEFRDYLNNEDVWYIVDGREPMEYVAKTILICSPQKRYYSTFDKLGTTIRYMPVWSWEETDTCRNVLFRDLTQKKVKELHNKWGGIPRFTLFYGLNISQQELLQKAINSVNDKILNFVGETTEDNSASHKIVHIRTNMPQVGEKGKGVEEVEEISEIEDDTGESSSSAVTEQDKDNEGVPFYTLSNLDFASDYVYEKVMDVLLTNYREQLQTFVQASKSISDYGTLRGTIFERIAHGKLLNGGSFKVRPLFGQTTSCFGISNSNRKLTIPPRDKLLFSKPDEVIQNRYCIPTQKNNASFDAFVSPDTFFQMTIADNHPIIRIGLEKYIKDDNSDINFYFVLPTDLYNDYKPQALHTTNRTVLKNKPPWFNRFKQYALELDPKLVCIKKGK